MADRPPAPGAVPELGDALEPALEGCAPEGSPTELEEPAVDALDLGTCAGPRSLHPGQDLDPVGYATRNRTGALS